MQVLCGVRGFVGGEQDSGLAVRTETCTSSTSLSCPCLSSATVAAVSSSRCVRLPLRDSDIRINAKTQKFRAVVAFFSSRSGELLLTPSGAHGGRMPTTSLLTRYSTACPCAQFSEANQKATSTTKSSFPHSILWLSLFAAFFAFSVPVSPPSSHSTLFFVPEVREFKTHSL